MSELRRECRKIRVGKVEIGGGAPISVQSMTNTDTRDAQATLAQIERLYKAGADIVRVSVYDEKCAQAVRTLVDHSPVPLVADIHFDHKLALAAMENVAWWTAPRRTMCPSASALTRAACPEIWWRVRA